MLEGLRQGAILVQAEVWHHECEGSRHPKIGDEADQEGGDDAHRDGLLGVLDFFTYKQSGGTTTNHEAPGLSVSRESVPPQMPPWALETRGGPLQHRPDDP